MTWSQRLKTAFETLKRMAVPLYVFYIAFYVIIITITFATIFSFFLPFMSNNGFYPLHYSTSYNPFTPVPPGMGYSYNLGPFGDLSSFITYLRPIFGSILTVVVLVWLLSSLYLTGVFHLTKKALTDRAQFRDFHFEGFTRILGFYGLMSLIGIIILMVGTFIAASLQSEYSLFLFVVVSLLILLLVGLFISPWLFSAPFYMLNNLQMSFGESFKGSWDFFRRHMFPLWGGFLTVFIIQLISSFLSENSPTFGLLITLVVFPFLTIVPMVWVLTLEKEEQGKPYSYEKNAQDSYERNYQDSYERGYQEGSFSPSFEQDSFYQRKNNTMEEPKPSEPEHSSTELGNSEPPRPESPTLPEPSGIYNPPKDPYAMPQDPYATPEKPYIPPSPPSQETEKGTINFCSNCGTKVREGAFYCSQCGTKL
ncbi:MAG: zinc-ribbon domain-containing protein [Desulfitobacterium sp.]|nr:zinc-ribbon domain-containing protein [Desulfitobacterium sp.]